jgi:hypothetical protein
MDDFTAEELERFRELIMKNCRAVLTKPLGH